MSLRLVDGWKSSLLKETLVSLDLVPPWSFPSRLSHWRFWGSRSIALVIIVLVAQVQWLRLKLVAVVYLFVTNRDELIFYGIHLHIFWIARQIDAARNCFSLPF
jgi:hypothetical protein